MKTTNGSPKLVPVDDLIRGFKRVETTIEELRAAARARGLDVHLMVPETTLTGAPALKVIEGGRPAGDRQAYTAPVVRLRGRPRANTGRAAGKTNLEVARDVLGKAGEPLTTREVLDRLLKVGFRSSHPTPISVVGSTLLRAIGRKDGVVRDRAGKWGLPEWLKARGRKALKRAS